MADRRVIVMPCRSEQWPIKPHLDVRFEIACNLHQLMFWLETDGDPKEVAQELRKMIPMIAPGYELDTDSDAGGP